VLCRSRSQCLFSQPCSVQVCGCGLTVHHHRGFQLWTAGCLVSIIVPHHFELNQYCMTTLSLWKGVGSHKADYILWIVSGGG
jgi:hypothetical protein